MGGALLMGLTFPGESLHPFIGLRTGKGVLVLPLPIRGYPAENFGGNQTDEREFLVELILRFFVRE